MYRTAALLSSFAAAAYAQQIGTNTPETHPPLPMQSCSAGGSCTTLSTSVVLDANWRWLHNVGGYTNCYTGNTWSASLCPDGVTCAANCALDGGDYAGTYGITTSGNALSLGFVTKGANTNVGSRTYLMDSPTTYKIFKLKGQEFTFDVDVSTLPCGLNGALYFVEMDADGGVSKYPTNKAGAAYGTGYCDSQCPQDIKFINGVANSVGWVGDSNSANAGTGMYGSCCTELDIWEANKISEAYTPHPCSVIGQTRCTGNDCGNASGERYAGVCDHDGCDFNSYRMGNQTFYGPGMTVDTTKKITVVTQFITSDGTAAGTLTEIKRFYVQNGVVIPNSNSNVAGVPVQNYISDDWCVAQKTAFGDTNSFTAKGGLGAMGQSMDRGHVLVLSIWDDYAVNMLWLDSTYPTTGTGPGTQRGTCATTSGAPTDVEAASPGAKVIFSNIKIGPIGSTFSGSTIGGGGGPSTVSSSSTKAPSSTSTPVKPTTSSTSVKPTTTSTSTPVKPTTTSTSKPASSTTSTGTGPMATHWGQCAGIGYTGPTVCQSPWTCQYNNPYYSQCL